MRRGLLACLQASRYNRKIRHGKEVAVNRRIIILLLGLLLSLTVPAAATQTPTAIEPG